MCVVSFRSFIFSFIDYMGYRSIHISLAYMRWYRRVCVVGRRVDYEMTTGMLNMVGPTPKCSGVLLSFPSLQVTPRSDTLLTRHSTMIISEPSTRQNPCTCMRPRVRRLPEAQVGRCGRQGMGQSVIDIPFLTDFQFIPSPSFLSSIPLPSPLFPFIPPLFRLM
jgi:hypothetical protein